MKRRWFGVLVRRRAAVILMLLLQLGALLFMTLTSLRLFHGLYWVFNLLSLLVVLYIINKKEKPAYKLTWVTLILLLPIFGGLFYLLFRFQASPRLFLKRQYSVETLTKPLLLTRQGDRLPELGGDFFNLPRYLQQYAGFPVYGNTRTEYLTPGEKAFEQLIVQLEKAERYIFLEYFIIAQGQMWNTLLHILCQRAAAGVEVRLLYDDVGCLLLLPADYPQTLERLGIHCRVFNPFRPVLSSLQNNRDHRKMAVIDGRVAFTGGINLADEYINVAEKHGHWKDAALLVEGDAAWSFATMFLEMWSLAGTTAEDFSRFLPEPATHIGAHGYVQPYCDSPLDSDNVGEHVYLQIINSARDYLYINSPYLIVDDSMLSALVLAVKSGVDVRICTPHRGDKWLVHMTTRSYYRELICAGVRIYEYTPGFMHAKTFVSDDRMATVGTTNLDFRSLYLHFECGACLYDTPSVLAIKEDYLETLKQCREITPADCQNAWPVRLFQEGLRVFAPLM